MPSRRRRSLLALLAACLTFSALAAPAQATHEQGGSVTAAVTAAGRLTGTLTYLSRGSCTVGTATGQYPLSVTGPLGATATIDTDTAYYSRCLPGNTTQTATFDVDLAAAFGGLAPDGAYTVKFSSCCRVSPIQNMSSTATAFEARVRKVPGVATAAPVMNSNVATAVAKGYAYDQFLNAVDADGGAIDYTSRAGSADGPNTDVITLSSTGEVLIPATSTAAFSSGQYYVYRVRATDAQGDYSERDILLTVTANNKPPQVSAPTAPVLAEQGRSTVVAVSASDPNNAAPKIDTVSLSAAGLPAWATLDMTPGNPATGTLTLTPPAGTPDQTITVNLDAVDNDSSAPLSSTAGIQIRVGTPPDTAVDAAPSGTTGEASPAFAFSSPVVGASFECRVDAGAWTACTSPYTPGAALADGDHAFAVRAAWAGMTDPTPATVAFTVDTTAPVAPRIDSRPADATNHAVVVFGGEGAFSCRVDGGSWSACTSPLEPTGLADGPHLVEIRSADAAGNTSAASTVRYTQDTAAPAIPAITEGPAAETDQAGVLLRFAGEGGGSYECRVDSGAWTPCLDHAAYPGLAQGDHVFEVRQIDAAGNVGAARVVRFTVVERSRPGAGAPGDTGPKEAVAHRPTAVTAHVAPVATIRQGDRVAVGCRLDQGSIEACSVKAYAVVRGAGGKARKVLIGAGRARLTSAGRPSREVAVTLNARGRRLLARALGGVPVLFRTAAKPYGSGTVLHATAAARVFPAQTYLVPGDGLFAVGSARLSAQGLRFIRSVRGQLRNVRAIACVGHTDALGDAAGNRRLGLRRARAVCAALTRGDRLGHARTRSTSEGERAPRATNRTRAGRALNRRVELRVTFGAA